MSEYKNLYEFNSEWKATRVVMDRNLNDASVSFCVTFSNGVEEKTLEFIRADDPENIIEFMDFECVTVLEELNAERDFCKIKVELISDCYSELWCDAVLLRSAD
ncbi:hypothetical protein [Marinomonas algarum]|uniref:Uncharacterized protein n=1 Tax=Marinomonas algarum TaxID=2883105 RepID=A0A9X1IL01_9GAMM|nr:hypothetical protein [Marinomonas algarum]MCB5160699.1 hypothetical protein [Marinomonas algarum]